MNNSRPIHVARPMWCLSLLLTLLIVLSGCAFANGEARALSAAEYRFRAVSNVQDLVVREQPGSADHVITLPSTTAFGSARVLLVKQIEENWVEVFLPIRPNGSTGWVAASDVTIDPITEFVTVDLEQRTIVVSSGAADLLNTKTAIGSETNPTPKGLFYITDKILTDNPEGAYGPFALGLSGYSETLSEFAGGPGQIGLHGTNMSDSIGKAASAGCLRITNEEIVELAETLPLGTPVYVS